jgi:hypothetical protein
MKLGQSLPTAARVPTARIGRTVHLKPVHSTSDNVPSTSGRDLVTNVAIQRRTLVLGTLLGLPFGSPAQAQSQLTPEALQAFREALSIRGSYDVR